MIAKVLRLVAFATLAAIPLQGVRVATNLLVLTCSIFLAGQIVLTYRAPVDPVTAPESLAFGPILTVAT